MEKRKPVAARSRMLLCAAALAVTMGCCAVAGIASFARADTTGQGETTPAAQPAADKGVKADAKAGDADGAETPATGGEEAPTMADVLATGGVSAATSAEGDGSAAAEPGDAFSMDADCASCHDKATKKMLAEGYIGELHASLACISCHDDEEALASEHAENYSAKKAKRVVTLVHTDTDDQVCFACHGDMEALAELTADSTVLTDKNGTTVNPHALPEGHYGNMVTCGKCHKMHDTKDTEVSATNACLGCHHDNVYECGTCHSM